MEEKEKGFVLCCSLCDTKVLLPETTRDYVSLTPATGWMIDVADNRIIVKCPNHSQKEEKMTNNDIIIQDREDGFWVTLRFGNYESALEVARNLCEQLVIDMMPTDIYHETKDGFEKVE